MYQPQQLGSSVLSAFALRLKNLLERFNSGLCHSGDYSHPPQFVDAFYERAFADTSPLCIMYACYGYLF